MAPITGIITTLNEEHNIVEAVNSLFQICDEVIVVDSLSSDQTVALAQQTGRKPICRSIWEMAFRKMWGFNMQAMNGSSVWMRMSEFLLNWRN